MVGGNHSCKEQFMNDEKPQENIAKKTCALTKFTTHPLCHMWSRDTSVIIAIFQKKKKNK
jgi:lipoate-protein ligase A